MKMTARYKQIDIAKFPVNTSFEGYLWYSDSNEPIVLEGNTLLQDIFTALPFIIEGNLYSAGDDISIQIKCIDGKYHIAQIDLSGLDFKAKNESYDVKTYAAHRVGDWKCYKMLEAWKEVEDKEGYLAGMSTLEPAWSAFIGFTNEKESNK